MRIPFHRPIISKPVNKILEASVNSGWLTTGPKVKEFEECLKSFLSVDYVVATNSCTAALHLALLAKKFKRGDKVIVPTYTFVASVEIIEYLGLIPILVDSDLDSHNINVNTIEDILKKDNENSIKAIIPVHFGGLTCDMEAVNFLAKKYQLFILEDAAHALESNSNIGKVGNTNYAAAFSFYANKNITTGGEGGALATNSKILADKVRQLSLHGMNKDGWNRFSENGNWAYDVSELGCKYNMTDISASFGIDQFSNINMWSKYRLQIVKQYNLAFKHIDGLILPHKIESINHARHLYIVKIKLEKWKINRNELIKKINNRGIGTSVHYIPVHMHSYYKNKYNFKNSDFKNAYELSKSVISLPLYPDLNDHEITYIIDNINDLWFNYKI